jgi:probable phosphoglycerate mutase
LPLDTARDFQIRNASINRFSLVDGKLSLAQWGDVEHLTAGAMDELP